MHESTRNQLEKLLENGEFPTNKPEAAHLQSCVECSSELQAMRQTATTLRLLRPEAEVEPTGGFYARVMQRIEERAKISEWAAFLYSPFSKRLAYASLSAAVVFGLYVFTAESQDGHLDAARAEQPVQMVAGSPDQQRDAVIVNFASFEGSAQ